MPPELLNLTSWNIKNDRDSSMSEFLGSPTLNLSTSSSNLSDEEEWQKLEAEVPKVSPSVRSVCETLIRPHYSLLLLLLEVGQLVCGLPFSWPLNVLKSKW